MTSDILAPRNDFTDCSPSTHLTASEIFDLPQPLGPTIPVIPGWNSTLTLSANDLKPCNSILFKYIYIPFSLS